MTDYSCWKALLQPLPLSWFCLLASIFFVYRRWQGPRPLLYILVVSFALLTAASSPIVGYWGLRSLEKDYQESDTDRLLSQIRDEPMVVLAGYARRPTQAEGFLPPVLGLDSQLRCLRAAALYHQLGPRTVVVSGGKVDPQEIGPPLAELMRDFLIERGVARDNILLEVESRNTHENALFTSRILERLGMLRIVLISDATHLPRASGSFRAHGCSVIPLASVLESSSFQWSWWSIVPSDNGAEDVATAFHEWAGMGVYWWYGWMQR